MDNTIKVNGIWVPANDQHIESWLSGEPFTQNKCLNAFLAYCQVKKIKFNKAIDIGAWCGTWTVALQDICKKVVAFEPDPLHYECLVKNVSKSSETHQLAVGSKNKLISLSADKHTQAKRVVGEGNIPMVTIDELKIKDVDILKIDVEGFEMEVLKGAYKTLKDAKYLMIELNNNSKKYGYDNGKIEKYLEDLGWKVLLNHWPDKVYVKK
jgi:FkbM family methyltransferase